MKETFENPEENIGHITYGNQENNTSQYEPVNPFPSASHNKIEHHMVNANHDACDNQEDADNHSDNENLKNDVNREKSETHHPTDIQHFSEKYARYNVKKNLGVTYDELTSQEKYVARKEAMLEDYIKLRVLKDILYDVQEHRKANANRERGLPLETRGIWSGTLKKLEADITKEIEGMLERVPEWEAVFKPIKGLGPRLGAGWISNTMIKYVSVKPGDLDNYTEIQRKYKQKTKGKNWLVPVLRGLTAFKTISSYWKWCGHDVQDGHAPRRRRGAKITFSPKMQVLAWKTRGQFVKLKGKEDALYREVYDQKKDFYSRLSRYAPALEKKEYCPNYLVCTKKAREAAERRGSKPKPPSCKGHIDSLAQRAMIKVFMKNMLIDWYRFERLPTPIPYDPTHKHHNES